jgi:preprotein translocase subunit SecB
MKKKQFHTTGVYKMTTNGNAPSAQESMASLPMAVAAQYIKDLSFENPRVVQNMVEQKGTPEISVNIQVQAQPVGEKAFEVSLIIEATAKHQEETSFLVELTYAGIFTFGEVNEEILKPYLLIECPRLLFPFARNIIAEITQSGGMPPLYLNPMDFAELYRHQHLSQETHATN